MTRGPLLRLDRASLLAATLVAASLNRLFAKMAESVALIGWPEATLSLFGVSAVIWIALAVLIDLGGDGDGPPPNRLDWWLCGSALAVCLLPIGWESALALLGLSIVTIARFGTGTIERRLAIVGLALTGPLLFAPLALAFLAPELLRVDAVLVSLLSSQQGSGNVVEFADPALRAAGQQLVIYSGCSSFHNISLVGVLFAVVTQLLNLRLTKGMWLLAVAMAAATVAINCARITAIALMPQHYETLHEGWGGQLIGLVSLLAAGAIIVIGGLRSARRQHA
jgi:hypothetical protein